MGEIRIVGPGKTRGYPYPVCKKLHVAGCHMVKIWASEMKLGIKSFRNSPYSTNTIKISKGGTCNVVHD